MTTVIFSHGKESGPWGTKIRAMAELVKGLGCAVDSIDYQGMEDPSDRVSKLIAVCKDLDDAIVLVGSSMGGHVAASAAAGVGAAGLFVIAPAFYMPGYEDLTPEPPKIPIAIVHGWRDEIVPVENSIRFAASCRAELHVLDGGHRLTENIDEINYYLQRFIEKIVS